MRPGALAEDAGVLPPAEVADALRRLGRHYIPARYPDAHPSGPAGLHYGPADADEALRDVGAVLDFVARAWSSLGG